MRRISQAVILAGGQGVRLRPLSLVTPKPMIPIHGKPFLEYIIELLKKNGIKEIVILTGYLHGKIEDYFKDGQKFGLKIKYSFSPVEDETGTRIRKAKELLGDTFLLLYADNYWPLNLEELTKFYYDHKALALVTVYSNADNYTKNNVRVNEKGFVEIYDKKRLSPNLNGVDIGFYILNKKVLNLLPEENVSFETTVLPKLIGQKQLAGFLTYHKYYGLSNLERIPVIEKFFTAKKVVFLDRDGVINKKAPKADYIKNWGEFVFLPKAKEALKLLHKKGYSIILVTNQPGIARGMMNEKALEEIHQNMQNELKKMRIEIDDIFICQHGWDDGCFCRKPKPGMFFQAAAKHNINLFESYCICDSERDALAARAAGVKPFLVTEKQDLYTVVKKYL